MPATTIDPQIQPNEPLPIAIVYELHKDTSQQIVAPA